MSNQGLIHFFVLPEDCTIEINVRDKDGNVFDALSMMAFSTCGEVIVNGKKANHSHDIYDAASVARFGVLSLVERVAYHMCSGGDVAPLSALLKHVNAHWPKAQSHDLSSVLDELRQSQQGVLSALLTLETKIDWNSSAVADLSRMVGVMATGLVNQGALGPVRYEDGEPVPKSSLGAGYNYGGHDDEMSTVVYGPSGTRILRIENGEVVISREQKRINAIVPAATPSGVKYMPLLDRAGQPTGAGVMPHAVVHTGVERPTPLNVPARTLPALISPTVAALNPSSPEEGIKKQVNDLDTSRNAPPPPVANLSAAEPVHSPPPPVVSTSEKNAADAAVVERMAPHQQDRHRKTVKVTEAGVSAVVPPNYVEEKRKIDMQPYHSYGGAEPDHMMPLLYMKNRPVKHAFTIKMEGPAPSGCTLFRDDVTRGKPEIHPNITWWALDIGHVMDDGCAARHVRSNGDGTFIEAVVEFHSPKHQASYCLIVDSFRGPNGGMALFGYALQPLQLALGLNKHVGRFVLNYNDKFCFDDVPPDVHLPSNLGSTKARNVEHLLEDLRGWLSFNAASVLGKINPSVPPHSCKAEDDLVRAMEKYDGPTKYGSEVMPQYHHPTTIPRMMENAGKGSWGHVLNELNKACGLRTAKFGIGYDAARCCLREAGDKGEDVKVNMMLSLFHWRRRAINHVPRIAGMAMGVANGFKLDPLRPQSKRLSMLNDSAVCDQGYMCYDCGAVYATLSERRICSAVDFVLHHATALEGGYTLNTDLRVSFYSDSSDAFEGKPGATGWRQDWCRHKLVSVGTPYMRVVPFLRRVVER
uniref:VP5 n=1 Tax=Tarumizu tick virus TaxID=2014339 RepID=A0A292G3C6_9REOV|nr:VP5 [Tarumizu tick virus]